MARRPFVLVLALGFLVSGCGEDPTESKYDDDFDGGGGTDEGDDGTGGDDDGGGGDDGGGSDDGGGGDDGGADDGGGGDDGGGTNDDGGGGDDGGDTTTGDGGDPGTPAGSCGEGGPKSELVEVTLGSPERFYIIGAPDTDEPLPLVLAFHGDEGSPYESTYYIWGTNFWASLPDPGFIAVMTKCPGCESWYQGDTAANAQYVWDVLTDVASHHNVDVNRVYAVGYSGGSEFLSIHGWEFQGVFAAIQFSCGGNAYRPYQEPPRPDCKVRGRIVISRDDFLWDGAQDLLQRLETEGHIVDFVEAQCSGHCCDTPDRNVGAWEWFQTHTKCGGLVTGECAELEDLP